MTKTIEHSIDIDVPVRTAYNQWTQFEAFPQFMEGVEEVRQLDDTHLHWEAEIAGVHREWDAEIVEQDPDRRIAWRSTSGAVNSGEVGFESIDPDHTRVMLKLEVEPEGFVEKAGEVLGLIDSRVERDLERFKDLIERQGFETGAWRGRVEDGEQRDPAMTTSPVEQDVDRLDEGPV